MCGICGAFNTKITREQLKKCTDTLEHRGPDDSGVWMDELCAFGHRRLSILDLSSAGHQPFVSADERYYIVLNGEVYNFLELKDELMAKGYVFKSNTDTEVVLYSYIEWGEECQLKFNGMWAFAVYDSKEKNVFMSRDRFGIKPLYYAEVKEGIGFGSEMKALMPMLDTVSVNTSILTDKNRYMNYEATEECLIKEIKRLPAGYQMMVTLEKGKVKKEIKRWWNTLEHLMDIPQDYEEQVKLFRELFLDACRIRMRSDVTLGTALSGGLDSSATICGMAAVAGYKDQKERVNEDFQHAFVASMEGTVLDETQYAREVTDYLNIPLSPVKIDPVAAIDRMPEFLYKFEDVYLTSPVPMMQTYEAMKKGGVTVTLDGHGADELFGGYTGDMLYALLDIGLNNKDQDKILDTYYGCRNLGREVGNLEKVKRATDFRLRHYAKTVLKVPTWDRIIDKDNMDKLKAMDHYDRTLYNSTHTTILPTLLRNYDRYSMASGVEIRMPFMDYRIVELAFSITWRSKLRNGFSKSIIRDGLRDIMPQSIVDRKSKVGFSTPYGEWAKGPWKEWLLDEMNSSSFINCTYIDANKVKENTMSVIEGRVATGEATEQIWMDMMPYLWEKYFLKYGK